MELIAVNLDNQPALRPQEVDEEAANRHVHPRHWDPMAPAEAQQPPFQNASGGCFVGQAIDRDPAPAGSIEGCFPALARKDPPDISERPCRGCDRDGAAPDGLVIDKRPRTMERYPAPWPGVPGHWHRDVDRPAVSREQLPKDGGALMAEYGAVPTCLHRREPSALLAERLVTNRVHTAVEQVQPTGSDAALDAGPGETAGKELTGRQDTMLPLSRVRDPRINAACGQLGSHTDAKWPRTPVRPPLGALKWTPAARR
jgi:hypothetical protein